jgi:hypothetical protein
MGFPACFHRRWRTALTTAAGALLGLVVCEIIARFVLGLGDAPLFESDPKVEYIYKPSGEYRRFGHRIKINAFGMRSEYFPPAKSTDTEIRVLFVGDSIIHGGSQTDQEKLATRLIERRLREQSRAPVIVANASAGGWGRPMNWHTWSAVKSNTGHMSATGDSLACFERWRLNR